jgi:hypothetical protein
MADSTTHRTDADIFADARKALDQPRPFRRARAFM